MVPALIFDGDKSKTRDNAGDTWDAQIYENALGYLADGNANRVGKTVMKI
jgi:hypothetical protein